MTELLRQAVENMKNDVEVQYSDQLILEWMDEKVYRLETIKDLYQSTTDNLGIGAYDNDRMDFDEELELCGWVPRDLDQCFMYRGLPVLSRATGIQIRTEPHTADSVSHYIIYKGIKFYELTRSGELLR